jgi:hypothetical protein
MWRVQAIAPILSAIIEDFSSPRLGLLEFLVHTYVTVYTMACIQHVLHNTEMT